MIIPIAATGSELHRSNRRVASCETGIWKEYAETKVELAAALLRERELLRRKKALLQRQDMLAQEFEHRLLNSLQVIVSLLSLQSRAATTVEAAAQIEYRGRACGGVWTRASTLASPRSSEERWVQAISPALWTRAETRRNAVDRKPNSSATSRADVRRKDGCYPIRGGWPRVVHVHIFLVARRAIWPRERRNRRSSGQAVDRRQRPTRLFARGE